MRNLVLALLWALPLWAQTPTVDQLGVGVTVEVGRDSQRFERVIVGTPHSKLLSQDADFALRAASLWQFWSLKENVVCFMRGAHPVQGPAMKADLVATDILLEMPKSSYDATPVLGDSLYFLYSVPRTEIVNGVEVTHEDSREWGPVHHRDFVRIVESE